MNNTAPNAWSEVSLGDHAHIKARIGWRGLSSTEYTSSGAYLIAGTHIKGAKIQWEKCDHINDYRYEESPEIQLREHDVVISKDGTIGRLGYVENMPGPATINGTMMLIRPGKTFYPKFIYFYLQGDKFQKIIKEKVSGSSVPHIFQRDMVTLSVPCPPLPEQQKIAEILSSVDDVTEKIRIQIDKLKDLKSSMMQELLTKGIGHTEFKDSPVGRIPSNWYCIKMNTIAKVNDGAHHTPTYTSSGIPFLRVTDLKSKQIFSGSIKYISREEHNELIKRCKPEKGDILYSKNGTIGIPRLIDWDEEFSIFVSLALIKITSAEVLPEYLALFMDSPIVREQIRARSKQGTVTNLHLEEIRDFDIPLPSMEEQQKITRALNSVIHRLEVAIEKYESNQKLKKALMQDLLTGKVRVNVDHKESAVA